MNVNWNKLMGCGLAVALYLAVPGTAQAQEAAADPTNRFHDGFYLRLSLGGGYLNVAGEITNTGTDYSLAGGSGAFDIMIGGTPAPGIVVGGAIWGDQAPSPSVEFAGVSSTLDANMNLGMLGVFIDAFPDPRGIFHLGALLGGARLSIVDDSGGADGSDSGFGGGVFFGLDAWIADQWALGGMLRASLASVTGEDSGIESKSTATNMSLLFTALHH